MSRKPQPAASVIRSEIARFDALAAEWWDETGPMRALHRINPARLEFIRDAVAAHFGADKAPLAGLNLLDMGCGAGILSEPLARLGAKVTGLDAAPEAIKAAAAHAAGQGLKIAYQNGNAEDLVATGAQFDVVCALEILEHVAEPEEFVRMVTQLVRPGGLLILSTLNRTAKSLLLGIVAAEYVLGWVPRGTHDWRKFIAPSQLIRWLRQNGCALQRLSGLVYDPLQQDFKLHPHDVDINYLLAAVRPEV